MRDTKEIKKEVETLTRTTIADEVTTPEEVIIELLLDIRELLIQQQTS